MAGVLDKYIAGSSTGQSAAASSGGVFGTVKIEGVLDKYIEKPSDPIYDQWKLEQQMKEQMRQWRAQKAAQEEEKGVFAQVPQAVEPKTKEELRADRKAAIAEAREERRQARGNAALETLTAASNTAKNGVSTNFEKALEGSLPSFWQQWRKSGEDFQEEKTAAWVPENQQVAPERYDPFVQNAGQAKAEWYDPEVVAKGAASAYNPLNENYTAPQTVTYAADPYNPLAVRRAANEAAEKMDKEKAIATLTDDQKQYINYLYGKYDRKLADDLADTFLQGISLALNAKDDSIGQTLRNIDDTFVGSIENAPVYVAEMLGQSAKNLAQGSNLAVADYTEGSRRMQKQTAATQDLVDNAKTPVGEFLTQTGVGMGQNVLNMVLFGKLAPTVMAMQAAASGGYEAAQNGATGWQQLGKGAQSAITELITEKISFGKLEDILNGATPKTVKGVIAKIAAQMATEAGEETAGEAISILYDWIAMGDKGDLAQVMKEYREENGDDGAGGYLALQILQRLAEAAAGGAISGGILGGGATVMNAVQNRNAEKEAAQAADLTQEAAKAAGDDAAQVEPETVQGAVEGGAESFAPIEEVLNSLPQGPQQNVVNEKQIDGILKELGYNPKAESEMPVKEPQTAFKGRVDDSAIRDIKLTERQQADRKVYDALSSALGVKIRLIASEADEMGRRSGANGYYDRRTNSFVFDINAENFFDRDRDAKGQLNTAAVLTMSHELTHYIQRWSPEQYGVLRDTVMRILQERTGQDAATIIARKRQTLEQAGQQNLNDAAVLDEIVADGCQMMLRDSGLFEQIAEKNRTLGQKIIDWLRGAVNALRKAYEGLSARSSEAKYIAQVTENYQRVLDRWTEALMSARDISMGVPGEEQTAESAAKNQRYEDARREGEKIAASEAEKRNAIVKASQNDALTMPEMVAAVDEAVNKGEKRTEAKIMEDRREIAKELGTFREFMREGGTAEEYLQNGAPEMREMRPKGWAAEKAIDAQEDVPEAMEKRYKEAVMQEVEERAALNQSRRQPWQVDLKTGEWEATSGEPGRPAPYQKPRESELLLDKIDETLGIQKGEEKADLQSTASQAKADSKSTVSQVKAPEEKSTVEVPKPEKTVDTPKELQEATPEAKTDNGSKKPEGSGWAKFKGNRIAQAMQHKPEGAVAKLETADGVRKAEEEIAHAKALLQGLKDNAEKGEIDDAESIAKGNKTLQDVPARFSVEKIALMAEQMRIIKEWEEQGLKGRKKEIAVEQYKNSNEILDRSDDELFNGEGQQKARMVSTGALMRRTPMRALVKVFGDTGAAGMAQDELIRPTLENESAKVQAINRIFDKVRKLDVNKYESTMVQLVGEGLVPAWSEAGTNPLWHNGQQLVESLPDYAQENPEIKKLAEHLDKIDAKKVTKAVKELRGMYNDYFELVNDFRLAHGMPEIGHIENYFPHFEGTMDGDLMNQALKAFGIEQMSNLPTGIAGLTANFKPKSRFVANFLQRSGPKTTFDAMAGFQMYTNAVMDMMYHTDDIMRLRYMESAVRERANMQADEGKRVSLSERLMEKAQDEDERKAMELRLDSITENAELEKEYGGFVVWLREYANALAGKGSQFDRGVEGYGSRNLQNVLNKTMSRYSTALVVGNLKSALANVSIVPKMMTIMATEGKLTDPEKYASKALVAMASGQMRDVWHKSEFLSGKEGVDPLVKKGKDIYAEKAQTVFDVIERFMSRFAFATKYQQQMDKMAGLDITPTERENAAVQAANDFAAQIMSRRDKAGATLYSRSRSPVMKMLNMYQNEIWNSFYQNIDDIPNALKAVEKAHGKEQAKKAFANVAAHYVVHCAILDGVCEAVLGFSIVPNPLEYLVELLLEFIDPDDEEEDEQSNMEAIVAVAADIAGHLPSISAAMALAGYDSGRVPLPNVVDLGDDILGIKKAETWQGKAAAVIDVLAGIGQFTGFPTSGQLAKTAKGVLSITEGGVRSRTTGQMQTVYKGGDGERLRALAFGPSGTKGMQEYFENGYKAELTQKQTQAYDAAIGSDIPKKKALEYVKWSKNVKPDKDENGKTISHSRNIKFLEQAASIEGLTPEQQAILYQGALTNDQAEEFAAMTQQVQDLGVDMETWLEFLKRYYKINGSGKKDKVKKLMAVLSIPPVWQKELAKVVGYEL